MSPGFPTYQCGRIDPQPSSHLPLRQAEPSTRGGKSFSKGVRQGQRVVPQELDDSRHVTDLGSGCVAFPTGNRHLVNANLVGNLLLEELEVQTARANLIT